MTGPRYDIKTSGSLKPTREERRKMHEDRKPEPDTYVEGRRPTATRTAAGALLGGPVGALIGFAWRKKTKQRIKAR